MTDEVHSRGMSRTLGEDVKYMKLGWWKNWIELGKYECFRA